MEINTNYVVLISADAEWQAVRSYYPQIKLSTSPFGEWFFHDYDNANENNKAVVFMHGGWGKVASAASVQYAVDKWHPKVIINLGTCGGIAGRISRGEIILVDKTIIYDIYEQMGDPDKHIRHYLTEIDISWIRQPFPIPVRCSLLVSGDRDLFCEDIPRLIANYGAVAADWESGAIAWVAKKNQTRCMILRGVTDLVDENGGEAYKGNERFYKENTEAIMKKMLVSLPLWISNHIVIDW